MTVDFSLNPIPPPSQDEHDWLTTYLLIHRLSFPSYRYTYLLWIVVVLVLVVSVVFHWNGRVCGSFVNGLWKKWGYRRRTWRKKHALTEASRKNKPHKQPLPLPSNAQLLGLLVLLVISLVLSFAGPDYIAPGTHIWDLFHNTTQPSTDSSPASFSSTPPPFTISKTWWTSGGRTGTIAFALFPLCVLFAIKAPPFAIFALPFFIRLYNDKLAFLHRWSGRLIWFITTLHVALWTVQLCRDVLRPGTPIFTVAFTYEKFVFGWLAFICLTLVTAVSVRLVRVEIYEAFYVLHLLFVPATLVFSALHFPPIGWWCWSSLILWGCERAWRLVRFTITNGLLGGLRGRRSDRYLKNIHSEAMEKARRFRFSYDRRSPVDVTTPASNWPVTDPKRLSVGQASIQSFQSSSSVGLLSHSHTRGASPTPIHPNYPSQLRMAGYSARGAYVPPPGYAHATLLPGKTVRLRLIPPHHFTWAPGQHVLLTIPSISKFSAHPFTIASICDAEAANDDGRELVILIRARTGFTKDLWMYVEQLEEAGSIGDEPEFNFVRPSRGVLLRACVDGPFGSSIRTKWTSYDTVLIIAGGSGVSFAASILEYSCMCLTGRNGKSLGGSTGSWTNGAVSQIQRVRFVWIVREFTHIQWASATIRRCLELISFPSLQIDIFVTHSTDPQTPLIQSPIREDNLSRPSPAFMWDTEKINHLRTRPIPSSHSLDVESNDVADILDMYGTSDHEQHVLDLTNFDGEDDTHLPGERQLSRRLREEGHFRREQSRLSGLPPFSRDSMIEKRMSGFLHPKNLEVNARPLDRQLPLPVIGSQSAVSLPGDTFAGGFPLSPLSANSSSNLVQTAPASEHTFLKSQDPRRHTRFDMDEIEAEDVPLVSELARPGRADINRIIAEEASRSHKSMIVTCCGPTTLNAVVRKSIAAQIKPLSVMRGQAPMIDLYSEDFEW